MRLNGKSEIMSTNANHIRYGLFINCLLLAFLVSLTTPGAVAYNVYYGQLHSHSNDSDGSGSPDYAYRYARDTAGLDFFSLADHCSYPYGANDGLTVAEYQNQQYIANSYNQDGVYVTFWGFEWTSDDTSWGGPSTLLGKGHITVINSPDHCEADEEATNDLNEFVDWLSTREAVAFFNHPGQYGYDFDDFNFNFIDKIVGMELWNRSQDYYGTGSWYHNALDKGWYIGATGSQDNHGADWGTMNEWRMAILAPELTRESLYAAMKARRFYSTRDKNLVLSFTCNGAQMGSKIAGSILNVVIEASDGDSEIFSRIDLLKNGTVIETWTPDTTNPNVTTTVNGSQGDYFYVRVYQSGSGTAWQAISSPIFITCGYVDFNCDGRVDFKDLAVLALYWSQTNCGQCGGADITGDEQVNIRDVNVVAKYWLTATTIPPLPEQASNPNPTDGALDVSTTADPTWTAGAGAISHDVYFGTSNPPPLISNQILTTFDPGDLSKATKFYWRTDEINGWGKTEGLLWNFRTVTGPPPPPPPPP